MARIPQPTLNLEQAKVALQEVLEAFKSTESQTQMAQVKQDAGKDIVSLVHSTIPLATQILQDVIKNYGFTSDGDGILSFTHIIKAYEQQDEQIQEMAAELKTYFIPPLPSPPVIEQVVPEN